MSKNLWRFAAVPAVFFAGVSLAQFPVLDMVANKVIEKYQNSSCEQLWAQKGSRSRRVNRKPIQMLRNDPAMRSEFINRVAAPMANKMFECGMIP
jgi:hypothetical protein